MEAAAETPDVVPTSMEVRLAESQAEIDAAQKLRYRVFYDEMGAKPSAEMAAARTDFDEFDAACDHLLVFDRAKGAGAAGVVGTYRLMTREKGEALGRFYTASEYDISNVLSYPGRVLELGRSCVDVDYRNRMTMQMLWRGIATYVFDNDITLMFGCASLPGVDPEALALPLSYLYHNHLAPAEIRAKALPDRYTHMDLLPKSATNSREALNSLPPLVKGYLRVGGVFGDGAVIDHQFNTIDVCVLVKTEEISAKYFKHYDRTARER